jgi:hypothetical protein
MADGNKIVGRNGVYFPTPADGGIGFDVNRPMAALCCVQHGDGEEEPITVDIIIFCNVTEQMGGATNKTGIAIGTEQGQFVPHGVGMTE